MKFIEAVFPALAGQTWQIIAIFLAIVVVFYLLLAIAEWKMFTKMGEKGWKAFIPVYNLYLLLKRCSKVGYIWHLLIAGAICVAFDALNVAKILPEDSWQFTLCSLIYLVGMIWTLVINIKVMHGVSKSFGHGAGFTVGLVLLTFIFQLILSFGSSEYRPVNKKQSK